MVQVTDSQGSETRAVSPFRRWLASVVESSWAAILIACWVGPPLSFVFNVLEDSPTRSWSLLALMTAMFFSCFLIPKRYFELWKFERDGRLYRKLGVRQLRWFADHGEGIQAVVRRIDPGWQNPVSKSKRSIESWIKYTQTAEAVHWGWLLATIPAIVLAYYVGKPVFATVYVFANIVVNIWPIMLQRYSRAKLLAIGKRRTSQTAPD